MKLKEIPKEELELMGYDDIAYIILQESGKKMKLVDIFQKVCDALELSQGVAQDQLLDFFELMSTNKKFTMLENGFWDLQSRHNVNIVIEDAFDEEDLVEDIVDDNTDEVSEEEDIFYEKEDDTEDVVDDELQDFMVIDEDEEQSM